MNTICGRDNGVIFYSNYNGSYISDLRKNKNNLPRYTYFDDTNLVYNLELSNSRSIHNYDYALADYNYNKYVTIEHNENDKNRYMHDSTKFFVFYKNSLKIMSVNKDYTPFDIDETVNSYFWIDDNTLAYSIKNKGIYLCNAQTMEKAVLIEGMDDFYIKDYQNGILYYDNKYLLYNLADRKMDSYMWIDGNTLAYSIKNKGIYLYKVDTQETITVIEGTDEFNIIGYENRVLYYDNMNTIYILY